MSGGDRYIELRKVRKNYCSTKLSASKDPAGWWSVSQPMMNTEEVLFSG